MNDIIEMYMNRYKFLSRHLERFNLRAYFRLENSKIVFYLKNDTDIKYKVFETENISKMAELLNALNLFFNVVP